MIIAWFSCGATSAVACKIALKIYSDVRIVYIDTGSCHNDNERFLQKCEKWYGVPIERIRSTTYDNVEDVIIKTGYINGPHGAACTTMLKKKVRYEFEDRVKEWEGQVWGFDYCKREINRAIRFKQQNPKTKPLFPLIEKMITKQDAIAMLKLAGIEIPMMYRLGYNNNNCIGCVKGGIAYWNKIRKDFPSVYARMAEIERIVGATCLKDESGKLWLDELVPNRGYKITPIVSDCSIICAIEFAEIEDPQTKQVMNGKISIRNAR